VFVDDTSAAVDEVDVLSTVIFNSVNYGQAQSYMYGDVTLTGISLLADAYDWLA